MALGVDTQQAGDGAGGEGGDVAGQQSRGEDGSHALELHAEQGGGQRRAEQTGEDGAHTGHDEDPAALALQAQALAEPGGGAAAQLQCCALTTGGAAEEVGQHGCAEDAGGDLGLQLLAAEDGVDDLIGAAVALELQQAIPCYAQQPAHGQQQHQPGMLQPQMGDEMEGMVEHRTQ